MSEKVEKETATLVPREEIEKRVQENVKEMMENLKLIAPNITGYTVCYIHKDPETGEEEISSEMAGEAMHIVHCMQELTRRVSNNPAIMMAVLRDMERRKGVSDSVDPVEPSTATSGVKFH